jgi:Toprim-like
MASFLNDLPEKILSAIKFDNQKAKESNGKLHGLECPVCHKKEAWLKVDRPFYIYCSRLNNCGEVITAKELYPDLWQDLAKRYPSTPSDPKATARAYLESRSLKPELIEFEQGIKDNHQTLVIKQDDVTFDRLIDYQDKSGGGKNRLSTYKGKVFKTKSFDDAKEVFITEGIIDALSWEQSGRAAIATYSSGSVPKEFYQANKEKHYLICFDNDIAGHKGINKTIECFKELSINYEVALLPKGKDTNDCLISGLLDAEKIKQTLDKAKFEGNLFLAPKSDIYFALCAKEFNLTRLIFDFKGKTYRGWIKPATKTEDEAYMTAVLLDCSIKLLHSVIDDSLDDSQKMEHFIEIESSREGINRFRLNADSLSKLDSFKSILQNHRQIFYGKADDLNHLAAYLFKYKPAKIRALNTIGFDDKSGGFYYPKFAYDVNGKRINANGDKYFIESNVKPFHGSSDTLINRLEQMDLRQFITDLHAAYGNKGLLALGFYVSATFSHLIFDHYGFMPFLSLYGDPHAGKSFLTKTLNRCFFVDSEGQTMTSSNTAKGELRKISQKSSMVCCLLEGRTGKSRFDYDGILALYNRNSLYSRATTDQSNRTHDLAFKAALSFVWNHEAFTIQPAKERVISLHFAENEMNDSTAAAWAKLNELSPEQLASLGDYILTNRNCFERELISWTKEYSKTLKENGIKTARIADNHAIALAGIVTLLESLKMNAINFNELTLYTVERAKNKLETAKTDSHLADYFFQSIADYSTSNGVATDKDGVLVVHLPTALAVLQNSGNGLNKSELIPELKRHDRFMDLKPTRALGNGKLDKCYHFKSE